MSETAYRVSITSFDPTRKIQSIMRIREVTGVGLAEAKAMIESVPSIIMCGLYRPQAEDLSMLLEETGMTAEIMEDRSNEPTLKNLKQLDFTPENKESIVFSRFVHEFEDDPRLGDLSIDLECPDDARINFEVIEGKDIWLSANRAGWLHLARICCEIGMQSQLEPGYHVHIGNYINKDHNVSPEVTFELSSDIA